MTKNPILNALSAIGYIVIIASTMYWGSQNVKPDDSVLAPILALSLFTLSAVLMVYIFGYQPVLVFLDGKKKEAVDLFLKTTGVFAGITLVILLLFFSGIIK